MSTLAVYRSLRRRLGGLLGGVRNRFKHRPPIGWVRFGSLRRLQPISRVFGFDRGQPIDRYYIERFLAENADDIHGHVLEVGDDAYTRKFGGNRVARADVLCPVSGNPQATIVDDLTSASSIPANQFDCIVLTQTLEVIYDARAAIRTLCRILKPGGVALVTSHGIGKLDLADHYRDQWHLTSHAARKLFAEVFPVDCLKIQAHGNVLAAIAALHGLSQHELRRAELDYLDPAFEVLVTVRATKPGDHK